VTNAGPDTATGVVVPSIGGNRFRSLGRQAM